MEKFIEPTYSIFINKRKIEVPYLIFLCHCTQELNTLQTLDEYTLLGSKPLVCDNKTAFKLKYKYLNNIHTFIPDIKPNNLNQNIRLLISGNIFKSSVVFLGLYYREFYNSLIKVSTVTYNNKELRLLAKSPHLLLNKIIGYPSINTSKEYDELQPWLNFYWKVAISNPNEIITIESLNDIIKKINPLLSLKDIKEDLNKHLIILPYKDYYVWSGNVFYEWLTTESRTILQALIWDRRLASSSFKLLDF